MSWRANFKRRHDWTDWAGFAFFSSIAVNQVVHYTGFSVFLMPLFMHPILTAATFLLRRPLVLKLPGLLPRLSGYASSFGTIAFFLFAQHFRSEWVASNPNARVRTIGLAIWLVSLFLDLCVVWFLRDSMSIVPQARKLITSGPFRYARHPLYATYLMQNVGLCMRFSTGPLFLALCVWVGITLIRIRYEERVLQAAFPEYQAYKRKVWMFMPSPRRSDYVEPTHAVTTLDPEEEVTAESDARL